ncbi:MAG: cbb3-type cytochrome c oxidase subunit II [Opitutae bacterium]|nr:cbb3-type cytochrome c oxidase subunit II [Opitutae bacterium]
MKNGLALFFGVFAALALSWAGLLLTAQRQFGGLSQFKDPADETLYPQPMPGLANQGRLVYQDLGCATCHTQQVRREGFGADLARKWGQRGGYARDYIRDQSVHLGSSRVGPDLRNAGNTELHAYADAGYFYQLLYAPASVAPGSLMPAHAFLFDVHPVAGRQPSAHALKLSSKFSPGPGLEVVPTARAQAENLDLMDKWLDAIARDTRPARTLLEKVTRNKPADAMDACYTADLAIRCCRSASSG